MKAKIIFSILGLAMALVSVNAEADRRGSDQHGRSHGQPHHGYVTPHRRHGYGRRHHRHHHHHHNLLAGAVLMGTIVATLDRPRPVGVAVSGPAYVVRQPYPTKQNVWYQRDVNGDCFEVQLRQGGTQLWTKTHPANCR